MSMLLVIIGLSDIHLVNRPSTRRIKSMWWIIKTALKGLFGFTLITILFLTILSVANKISDIPLVFSQIINWGLSGLFFGGSIGAITGLGYVKSISRQNDTMV
jgi:hypothetical protein